MSIDIAFEWLQAPGVRDPTLAATWARIQLVINGQCVTRFWSQPDRSVLDAVYTSAFPLARWIVTNWWFLASESLPAAEGLERGVENAPSGLRPWLRRHDPFLAREGMSYPDLCLFRAGDAIGITWTATGPDLPLPGRFMESGQALVPPSNLKTSLRQLVDATLARLQGSPDPEVQELRELWSAVRRSEREEPVLCERLAAFGLDPYAADLDEPFVDLVAGLPVGPEEALDLVRATNPDALAADAQAVADLHATLSAVVRPGEQAPLVPATASPLPYQTGYARAHALRDRLGLPHNEQLTDPEEAARQLLSAPITCHWIDRRGSAVDAVVRRSRHVEIAAFRRNPDARRFLRARALHHALFVTDASSPSRLLTQGHDWLQAVSRAFAAELLAPAAALAERRRGGWVDEATLARAFKVSPMVIARQLQNHRLAGGW